MNASWLDDCIIYHFYPLGLCGSPHENSWDWSNTWNAATRPVRRIDRVLQWVGQLKKLNVSAVYFCPVLQSDTHGYNTRDFYTLDSRLGSNEDFAAVCNVLHENGIRILFDALFSHVGRGFWAFRDIRQNKQESRFVDWFAEIDFSRDNPCSDGFYYRCMNGNWDFPELNLNNEEVVEHLFGAIRKWVDMFRIDGLRIGLVEGVDRNFMQRLRAFCATNMSAGLGGNLAIMGEIIRPVDYKYYVNEKNAGATTNYELYSAFDAGIKGRNLFPLAYTLNRMYGEDGVCRHVAMANFLENHNVERIATKVSDRELLRVVWGILFACPGSPSIYYGSEWGAVGEWDPDNSWCVRPSFEQPEWNDLTSFIQTLTGIRKKSPALRFGNFESLFLTKEQYMFSRESCGQKIVTAVNLSDEGYLASPKPGFGRAAFEGLDGDYTDLILDRKINFNGSVFLPPKSIQYLERV